MSEYNREQDNVRSRRIDTILSGWLGLFGHYFLHACISFGADAASSRRVCSQNKRLAFAKIIILRIFFSWLLFCNDFIDFNYLRFESGVQCWRTSWMGLPSCSRKKDYKILFRVFITFWSALFLHFPSSDPSSSSWSVSYDIPGYQIEELEQRNNWIPWIKPETSSDW